MSIQKYTPKQLRFAAKVMPEILGPEDWARLDRLDAKKREKERGLDINQELSMQHLEKMDETTLEEITDNEDFDIRRIMANADDPITGTMRDLRLDDRDLPLAKNFYDFAVNIIGRDANRPWAKQMWTGAMLFGEVCPCCSNPKWLDIHNVPKDYNSLDMPEHLQFLEYGKCPKCKRNKWELIQHYGLKRYIQLANVLGQRSGKSSSAAYMGAYLTHRYLKYPSFATLAPHAMQASTELTGTFVSLNFGKAASVLWTPYKEFIKASTWYKNYFAFLDDAKARYGQEFYRFSTLYMQFAHKNMRFYPSGPKSTTLRGDTRLFAMLDELGLFPLPSGDEEEDTQSERANADEAHKSLLNSLTTVDGVAAELLKHGQYAVPNPVLFSVSSPVSIRDKVMRLLGESRTPDGSKIILGINLATWHVNPTLNRDSAIIASAYMSNPVTAERDFGASPPAEASQYVTPAIAGPCFKNGMNSHNLTAHFDRPKELYARIHQQRRFPHPMLVAIDAGHVNNSFTLVAGYYDFDRGKTVITTILELVPHADRRINFNFAYTEMILPSVQQLNGVGLIADQWQSLDILYRVDSDSGVVKIPGPYAGKVICKGKQFSPRPKHFDAFRNMMIDSSIEFPSIEPKLMERIMTGGINDYRTELVNQPVAHLLHQILTVQDLGIGKCPAKGLGNTDDIFRALVALTGAMHSPKVLERLKVARDWFKETAGRGAAPLPVFVSRSMGGGLLRR